MININIIKVWEGPRHERLRRLWKDWAERNADKVQLFWFDNIGGALDHVPCYERMWEAEERRPERFTIFTEHDFLPGPAFLSILERLDKNYPVAATMYCTRDPDTKVLTGHACPGAWFIAIDKENLHAPIMYFKPGGPMNDTCNLLESPLTARDQKVLLLPVEDCMPEHYGATILDPGSNTAVGVHLFWSRYYHDSAHFRPPEWDIDDILQRHDTYVGKLCEQELPSSSLSTTGRST